jgi:phage-related tail fiber protein
MAGNMITTKKARVKIAVARELGGTISKITQISVGNGGLKDDGTPKAFDPNQNGLYGEIVKFNVPPATRAENKNTYKLVIEQSDTSVDGKKISEIGLIDAEGDLVAAQTFLPKIKDANSEFVFTLTEEI